MTRMAKAEWLKVEIGPGWIARYRIVPEGGRLVIAEVRVLPANGVVPRGGIKLALLRKLRPGMCDDIKDASAVHFNRKLAAIVPPKPIEDGDWPTAIPDLELARIAEVYVNALKAGKKPGATVDRVFRFKGRVSHHRIAQARRRGILTQNPFRRRGVAGGALTAKGLAILRGVVGRGASWPTIRRVAGRLPAKL